MSRAMQQFLRAVISTSNQARLLRSTEMQEIFAKTRCFGRFRTIFTYQTVMKTIRPLDSHIDLHTLRHTLILHAGRQ